MEVNYTVKSPSNGKPIRYEEEGFYAGAFADARKALATLIEKYPNLGRLVVPDHYYQEYVRAYDDGLYGGSRGWGTDAVGPFLTLAERGAAIQSQS